jgi:hypothetical protein
MTVPQPPFFPPPGSFPPAPIAASAAKTPIWAWLFVGVAALAVVTAFVPWFNPVVTANGQSIHLDTSIYAWRDGRLGLAGPLALLLLGVTWARALTGKMKNSAIVTAADLRKYSLYAVLAGVIGFASMAAAWLLLPHNYSDWNEAKAEVEQAGATLGRGPQVGFWLVGVASVLAIALGIYGYLTIKVPAATAWQAPPPPVGYPAQQPFQQQPYQAPAPGYQSDPNEGPPVQPPYPPVQPPYPPQQ